MSVQGPPKLGKGFLLVVLVRSLVYAACEDSSSTRCRLGTWKACLSELIESPVELWLSQCKVPRWRRAGVADVPCSVASTEQRAATKVGMKTTRSLRTVCETGRSRRLHVMDAKSMQC